MCHRGAVYLGRRICDPVLYIGFGGIYGEKGFQHPRFLQMLLLYLTTFLKKLLSRRNKYTG